MPEAENVAKVREFFEKVLNGGDMDALESLAHRDVTVPQAGPGIEGLRRMLSEARETFGNPQYKILETISEGEKVAVRFSAKATHSGRYMGLRPTGLALKLWGVMIFRFQAGGIAEFWSLVDSQGILSQLRAA